MLALFASTSRSILFSNQPFKAKAAKLKKEYDAAMEKYSANLESIKDEIKRIEKRVLADQKPKKRVAKKVVKKKVVKRKVVKKKVVKKKVSMKKTKAKPAKATKGRAATKKR
jgi:hypothetical protein